MRSPAAVFAVGLLVCAGTGSAIAGDANPMADYLSDGYRIVDKNQRIEILPGLPPYEDIPRRIGVTRYWLKRGDEQIDCLVRYDSQRDVQSVDCRR